MEAKTSLILKEGNLDDQQYEYFLRLRKSELLKGSLLASPKPSAEDLERASRSLWEKMREPPQSEKEKAAGPVRD